MPSSSNLGISSGTPFPVIEDVLPHIPRPPSNNPFRPTTCDPAAYPSDSIQHCLLTPPENTPNPPSWAPVNHEQFTSLCQCLLTNSCIENQDQVVILNVNHFGTWYRKSLEGNNGGETIWGISIIESLILLNYTFLYAHEFDAVQDIYHLFSTSAPAIIMSDEHIFECWEDKAPCVKSPENPLGPPIWKILTFHFWPNAAHPLGHRWTLSPEDYAHHRAADEIDANIYLPYTVEFSCDSQPVLPPAERERGRIWALAKRLSYLSPHRERAWPASFFPAAATHLSQLGVHFMIGAEDDSEWAWEHDGVEVQPMSEFGGDDVLVNIGLLDRPDFMREIARSVALLGVGRPAISPTPYQALCLGVPFINPIMDWDVDFLDDRGSWETQHNGLKFLGPPFVYNVRKNDEAGFLDAIARAAEHPTSRYIPPGRSLLEVTLRLRELLHADWRQEAEDLLGERIRTKGERFTL